MGTEADVSFVASAWTRDRSPDTFRIFLKERSLRASCLTALGKPSSNVPFIMPKRVADTDPADKQIEELHRLRSRTSSSGTSSSPATRRSSILKNTKYVPRKEPASGSDRRQERVRRPCRVEPRPARCISRRRSNALLSKGEVDIIEASRRSRAYAGADQEGQERAGRHPGNKLGNQYMARFNHLHKPFDNPKPCGRPRNGTRFNQEAFPERRRSEIKEYYQSPARRCSSAASPYGSHGRARDMEDKLEST